MGAHLRSRALFGASKFLRLAQHDTVVLGNKLFIDGGIISWRDEQICPNTDTLVVDLANSWDNGSLPLMAIPKPQDAPQRTYATLWAAPDDGSFYSYGGLRPGINGYKDMQRDENALWKFTPQRDGGVWAPAVAPPSAVHANAYPAGGLGATGNGTGFLLGGFTTQQSDEWSSPTPLASLLAYDMVANAWRNDSSTDAALPTGAMMLGRMHFLPQFGSEGLLVAFGGGTASGSNSSSWTADTATPLAFDRISVYDLATRTWHHQRAVGATPDAVPSNRSSFCSVGVSGGAGDSFEIAVYGGQAANSHWTAKLDPDAPQAALVPALNATNADKTGVHVLSLPSFTWFRADDRSAAPRSEHACAAVGRHMISVGGVDATVDPIQPFMQPDPDAYGIGVFDLVELKWRSGYNASAAPYEVPAVIQQYLGNHSHPVWDDPALPALFQRRPAAVTPAPGSTEAPAPSSARPLGGGTVAGAVVGAAGLLAVVMALAWYILGRRRHHRRPSAGLPRLADSPARGSSFSDVGGLLTGGLPMGGLPMGGLLTVELAGALPLEKDVDEPSPISPPGARQPSPLLPPPPPPLKAKAGLRRYVSELDAGVDCQRRMDLRRAELPAEERSSPSDGGAVFPWHPAYA